MKWLVKHMTNMTAVDTIWRGPTTQRTDSEQLFDTEEQAMTHYTSAKNTLRFVGCGQYVTYPREVPDDYQVPACRCDWCDKACAEGDPYVEMKAGNFCSKLCLEESQDPPELEEPYYEEEY